MKYNVNKTYQQFDQKKARVGEPGYWVKLFLGGVAPITVDKTC